MHDLTVLPSMSTVHAPQLPVSQPTCVPVRSSDVADEVDEQLARLDLLLVDLAVDLDADRLLGDGLGHRRLAPLQRLLDGAPGEDLREVAAVVRRGVDIVGRVEARARRRPSDGDLVGVGLDEDGDGRDAADRDARAGRRGPWRRR